MKAFFFLFFFLNLTNCISQTSFHLDETGMPEYRMMFSSSRAFQVYERDSDKVFFVDPRNYYDLGGLKDTLEFVITGDSLSFDIELTNKINGLSSCLKNNIFSLIYNKKVIEFDVRVSRSKQKTVHTPIKKGILKEDKDLGMVIVENRLTRYAKVNLNNQTFNIAILDKNKNGLVDNDDFLSVSFNGFFKTKESAVCTSLSKKTIVKIGIYYYKVTWSKGYNLEIKNYNGNSKFDIILSDKIPDLIFEDSIALSNLVKQNDYTIINIWSAYCSPCIKAIKELNKLNNVVGIHLDEKISLSRFDIKYKDFVVSQEQFKKLNVNGYPFYIVVNKEMDIVFSCRSFKDIDIKYK